MITGNTGHVGSTSKQGCHQRANGGTLRDLAIWSRDPRGNRSTRQHRRRHGGNRGRSRLFEASARRRTRATGRCDRPGRGLEPIKIDLGACQIPIISIGYQDVTETATIKTDDLRRFSGELHGRKARILIDDVPDQDSGRLLFQGGADYLSYREASLPN